MHDGAEMLEELRRFVVLHSRAQQLDEAVLRQALDEIELDQGDGPTSWTAVWSRLADAAGNGLDAIKLHNMARFPFVDGAARRVAHERCVDIFRSWAETRRIERWEFDKPVFAAYAAGLGQNRPVTIVTGGIVSIKEQWWRILALSRWLGLCVVATEMPQTGENRSDYGPSAPAMYERILNRLAGRADVSRVHLLAFSFSGQLALRAALTDKRIRRITTIGAPVHHYFTDPEWHRSLPLVTRTTLAHMLNCPPADLFERMRDWAMGPQELRELGIPVDYLASARDEIIPPAEYAFLQATLRHLNLLVLDDVHGSPNHSQLTALWITAYLLRGTGPHATWKAWLGNAVLRRRLRKARAWTAAA
jgi:pimeloyl-ACP methyl ester carboxylesterase